MILKGSQRGGGQDLAAHLMRTDENEHVELCELRGFAASDLRGAFKEAEAISRGTKCRQYLFSVSLSPPQGEAVPLSVFQEAIQRIEERVGLEGQPRAIVFHEKEGRRHAHCVWSRIDAETMTARPLPFFKRNLMKVARDLYLENGWTMPRGLENAAERNPTNFSLAEWQQAKRQDIDPRWLKQAVQDCWARADNAAAFSGALEERGLFLARGDKRGFVVMDHQGDVWALPRLLDVKTKQVAERLGAPDSLRGVAETQKEIGARMTPTLRAHVDESRDRFRVRSATLGTYKEEMTRLHRDERLALNLQLAAEWENETQARAGRLPTGLRGLWHRITGQYDTVRRDNELEAALTIQRHTQMRDALVERQLGERSVLQREFKVLRKTQAEQLLELRRDIGRFLAFTRGEDRSQGRARGLDLGLKR